MPCGRARRACGSEQLDVQLLIALSRPQSPIGQFENVFSISIAIPLGNAVTANTLKQKTVLVTALPEKRLFLPGVGFDSQITEALRFRRPSQSAANVLSRSCASHRRRAGGLRFGQGRAALLP